MHTDRAECRDMGSNRPAMLAAGSGARLILTWSIALVFIPCIVSRASAKPKLKTYKTRYYIIHTDLDRDGAREAVTRMTAMAREYRRRTEGFGGKIRKKLPFYLFRNREDYHAAGGLPGSAGVFTGRKLMAVVGKKSTERTWHVVQHEGFHQFVRAVIGGPIPIWANEGLAEYFGHGIFTGDDFIVGLVPPRRLARLKEKIKNNKLKPFRKMMTMSEAEWSSQMSVSNYDQAWSMIHFLIFARNARYRKKMTNFLKDISRQTPYLRAWKKNFGRDIDGFEKVWREYWLSQPDNPTADLYDKAVVSTMTSFFARAYSRKQRFQTVEEFFKAAETGGLKAHKEDWLPPAMLTEALVKAGDIGEWSIESTSGRPPLLVCAKTEKKRFVGTFIIKAGRVRRVTIRIIDKKPLKTTTQPGKKKADLPAGRPLVAAKPTDCVPWANAAMLHEPTERSPWAWPFGAFHKPKTQ